MKKEENPSKKSKKKPDGRKKRERTALEGKTSGPEAPQEVSSVEEKVTEVIAEEMQGGF